MTRFEKITKNKFHASLGRWPVPQWKSNVCLEMMFLIGNVMLLCGYDMFLFGNDVLLFGSTMFLLGSWMLLFGNDMFLFRNEIMDSIWKSHLSVWQWYESGGARMLLFGNDMFLFGKAWFCSACFCSFFLEMTSGCLGLHVSVREWHASVWEDVALSRNDVCFTWSYTRCQDGMTLGFACAIGRTWSVCDVSFVLNHQKICILIYIVYIIWCIASLRGMDSLMYLSVAILALIASMFVLHSVGEPCRCNGAVLCSSS